MEVIREIADRRSVRKYKSQEVARDDILQIIDAGRLAPTGKNTRPLRVMIVTDEAAKEAIVKADHHQKWMLTAPVFLVCLGDIRCRTGGRIPEDMTESSPDIELKLVIRDTAISVSYMLLEAQHLGLGTCWTGWYDQKEMKAVLGLPEHYYVSGIVTLGYAAESPDQHPMTPLEDMIIG